MTPSAVSHAVRTVEDRVGIALFARTTRSVSLTETGRAFVEATAPAFGEIAEQLERLEHAASGRASGLLRLNVPRLALPLVITPVLADMRRRHPDVTVEAFVDDGLTDIVARGFDAGVRLGEMISADMVAVRATPPFRAIIVGSPGYFRRRGRPKSIGELAEHDCIGHRLTTGGGLYRWELDEAGDDISVDVSGQLIVNDPMYAVDAALAGYGLAYVFEPLVSDALASGALVQVLGEHAIEEPGLFVYFSERTAGIPKLRAFLDSLARIRRRASRSVAEALEPG